MTGFDWFAYLAGAIFLASAFLIHSGAPRLACLIVGLTHHVSMSVLSDALVGSAQLFYLVFSWLDLILAVIFLGLAWWSRSGAVLAAAGIQLLGWGWGYCQLLETDSPGRYWAIAPWWFHVHGGGAYLAHHAALITTLIVVPALRLPPGMLLARLRGPAFRS